MDSFTVEITSLGSAGEGVAVLPSGKKLFVDSPVIPGEICEVEITSEKNKFARGKCIDLVRSSDARILPYGGEVPGANLAHISYDMQLKIKHDRVRDCLTRVGGFEPSFVDAIMRDIVPSERVYHYRNHMQYSLRDGRFCLKSQGSNTDVPVEDSPLEYEVFGYVRNVLSDAFSDYPTRLFDGVVLRGSERTGEVLIELVSYADMPSEVVIRDAGAYVKATDMAGKLSGIKVEGILLRISNTATEKRTRGGKRVVLYGADHYTEVLCGQKFKVKAGAFFQVNVPQAEVLYGLAASDDCEGRLWDLYCGTGTIGLSMVREGQKLIGVDISPEAIASAKENALTARVDAGFICKPASRITSLLADIAPSDMVVVDPPRAGLEFSLVNALLENRPAEISYISCDPATMARDLKLLTAGGCYGVRSVTPVDLFPCTAHVETVAMIYRVSP
ncbi:23S rRNA (uracil1939-C5)-methyltransferase [Ruminococcaceae bacterium YRB3002]|nr:23S rRNA (uracil1939-C5)-methyltransferase [Ruminococcaceae bacterium YRB3002]